MSSCILGQFIDILKKTDPPSSSGDNGELDARTSDDYEMLRNYATEGGEAHDGIEVELAVFITNGVFGWIRPCRQGRSQTRINSEKPVRDRGQWLLSILLANMIESRG